MYFKQITFFSLFFIGSLLADKMVFTGSAEIEHFDLEAARNKACIDALLHAAKFIQADLEGVNPNQKYETVYEEVLARTYGALKDIVFIKETQLDSYFIAKIQCEVDESKLDENGKVMPPDLAKLDQIDLPASGPILEGSEKIAKKLLELFHHRKKKDAPFIVALFPFGNQRGYKSEEIQGYAEILYGRLSQFLNQDPDIILLGLPQLEVLAKENELLMDSFDKPAAHQLVQKLGVEAVIIGRLDFLNLQEYKKADYFPVQLRIFFDHPGKVTELNAEIRSEDKHFVGGARIYSEKDARLNLNRIRNLYNNQNFSFDILVDGVPLKKYYIDSPVSAYIGYYFVESKPKQNFQIRISNQIYDKKSRRSAVGLLVDGKDCFYHEIKGKQIPIQTHHREVLNRFLLEKGLLISGWQVPNSVVPFMFQDQSETQSSGRLSIASVPGSITIFIYSQVLSKDQEGTAEGLMKDGELVDAKIAETPMTIYSNPIAIYKIFYFPKKQQSTKN
ncbi:MAG: hypothetical protein AABZ60_15775, partial [Planctomycetota bacterium]